MRNTLYTLTNKTLLSLALFALASTAVSPLALAQTRRIIKSPPTLAKVLDNIEENSNDTDIKQFFFEMRAYGGQIPDSLPEPLTVKQAIEQIDAAINVEKEPTNRWLLLQNVRASASFESPELDMADGYKAYNAIFETPVQRDEKRTLTVLKSISQYVYLVPKKLAGNGLNESRTATFINRMSSRYSRTGLSTQPYPYDPRTHQTLLKAWQAFVRLERSTITKYLPEPDFATAFQALNQTAVPPFPAGFDKPTFLVAARNELEPVVLRDLADPKIPHSYALLMGGVQFAQPNQAIEWLKEIRDYQVAKGAQPSRNAYGRSNDEVKRVYYSLIPLLEAQQRWPEAVQYQREQIDRTGTGYTKLWELLGKANDEAGRKALISNLKSTAVPTSEITRTIEAISQTKFEGGDSPITPKSSKSCRAYSCRPVPKALSANSIFVFYWATICAKPEKSRKPLKSPK